MLYHAIPLNQTDYIVSGIVFLLIGAIWGCLHFAKGKNWIKEKLDPYF